MWTNTNSPDRARLKHRLLVAVSLVLFAILLPAYAQDCGMRTVCCSVANMGRCGTSIDCRYFLDARSVTPWAIVFYDSCSALCIIGDPPETVCALCFRTRFFVSVTVCDGFEYETDFYLCCRDPLCCPGVQP